MDPMLTFAEDVQERKRRMLPLSLGGLQSNDGTLTNTVQPGRALPSALRTRLGKVQQQLDDMDGQGTSSRCRRNSSSAPRPRLSR